MNPTPTTAFALLLLTLASTSGPTGSDPKVALKGGDGVTIQDQLDAISQCSGIRILIATSIGRRTSHLSLPPMPCRKALELIARYHRLRLRDPKGLGSHLEVLPDRGTQVSICDPGLNAIFPLEHMKAACVLQHLRTDFKKFGQNDQGTLEFDERTNSILVSGNYPFQDQVLSKLSLIDTPSGFPGMDCQSEEWRPN